MSTTTGTKAKHDVTGLESRIKNLHASLDKLSSREEFEEMMKIIHFPGFTTEPEFRLVSGLIESMNSQVQTLTELKQLVVSASRTIVQG